MMQCEGLIGRRRCERDATLSVSPIRLCYCPSRIHYICTECWHMMGTITNWECFGCGDSMLWGSPVWVKLP